MTIHHPTTTTTTSSGSRGGILSSALIIHRNELSFLSWRTAAAADEDAQLEIPVHRDHLRLEIHRPCEVQAQDSVMATAAQFLQRRTEGDSREGIPGQEIGAVRTILRERQKRSLVRDEALTDREALSMGGGLLRLGMMVEEGSFRGCRLHRLDGEGSFPEPVRGRGGHGDAG